MSSLFHVFSVFSTEVKQTFFFPFSTQFEIFSKILELPGMFWNFINAFAVFSQSLLCRITCSTFKWGTIFIIVKRIFLLYRYFNKLYWRHSKCICFYFKLNYSQLFNQSPFNRKLRGDYGGYYWLSSTKKPF